MTDVIWFKPDDILNSAFEVMPLDFLICGSRLWHSFIVEGKKEFSEKSCFVLSWGIFFEFREKYLVFREGNS